MRAFSRPVGTLASANVPATIWSGYSRARGSANPEPRARGWLYSVFYPLQFILLIMASLIETALENST